MTSRAPSIRAVIVRHTSDRIQLITQPDHAHLARRIMEHCLPLAVRARREGILRAIGEHDNGWTEADAAPAVDSAGRIIDFVAAPLSLRHAVWPRAIARLADDPFAAALVAQHAVTAYERFRPEPEWSSFFADMETARDAKLLESGLHLEELLDDYRFVRLGDLISLVFCTGAMRDVRFADWTVELSGTRVVVTPDLFGGVEIPIEINARGIPLQPFRSDAQLRDALSQAETTTVTGLVSGKQLEDRS